MSDGLAHYVRYDVPDEHGQTRRERNNKAGVETEEIYFSDKSVEILDLFFSIDDWLDRKREGYLASVSSQQLLDWQTLTLTRLTVTEIELLKIADLVYCNSMNAEIELYHERLKSRGQ